MTAMQNNMSSIMLTAGRCRSAAHNVTGTQPGSGFDKLSPNGTTSPYALSTVEARTERSPVRPES
jgi:hypothetical protein